MALEAQIMADHDPTAPADPAPPERRRGRDRRKPGNRINKAAPRRSSLQRGGAIATGTMAGIVLLMLMGSELLLETMPWIALSVAAVGLVTAVFAFMIGCVEQRLIEIRLELMMANGGSRGSDRRSRTGSGSR